MALLCGALLASPFGLSRSASAQTVVQSPPSDYSDPDASEPAFGDAPVEQEDAPPPVAYQTMCVRTCDGYYFPIHQNALQQTFARDAKACSASCSSPAKLFYFPVIGGSPESMIDLDGRKYTAEPNAFAYRKTFAPNCTCKAAPWSAEAAARHQSYSAAAVEARLKEETDEEERTAAENEKASALISAAASRAYYSDDDQERTQMAGQEERPVSTLRPVPQNPAFRDPDAYQDNR